MSLCGCKSRVIWCPLPSSTVHVHGLSHVSSSWSIWLFTTYPSIAHIQFTNHSPTIFYDYHTQSSLKNVFFALGPTVVWFLDYVNLLISETQGLITYSFDRLTESFVGGTSGIFAKKVALWSWALQLTSTCARKLHEPRLICGLACSRDLKGVSCHGLASTGSDECQLTMINFNK